jgi:hypothetical protein
MGSVGILASNAFRPNNRIINYSAESDASLQTYDLCDGRQHIGCAICIKIDSIDQLTRLIDMDST